MGCGSALPFGPGTTVIPLHTMNAISAGCSFWPNCDGFGAERSGCNGLRTLRESAVLGDGFKYVWCLRRSNGLGLLMAGARAVGTKKGALNQSERLLIIPLCLDICLSTTVIMMEVFYLVSMSQSASDILQV